MALESLGSSFRLASALGFAAIGPIVPHLPAFSRSKEDHQIVGISNHARLLLNSED